MKRNKRIFIISFFTFITLITTLILINVINNNSKDMPKFMAYTGYYNSDQTTIIGNKDLDASNYQKMNTLYTASGVDITASGAKDSTKEYIAIESAMDFLAFSQLAKTNTAFLGYKYVLFNNINWKDIEGNAYFYPIGLDTTPFTGEFDGNGHTISNVEFVTVTEGNEITFANTHYFALFSKNSGTVKDFGLINPHIEIDYTAGDSETANHIHYVSNVVGLNTGTVSYVFVRDSATDDETKETPGIKTLNMNFEIAGLVAVNNGTFNNSYYASSTVYAKSGGKPAQFQEIMLMGTAPTNTFYYNALINNVSGNTIYYGGFIDKALTYTNHYGTYASSLADLNEQVKKSNDKWITPDYYEDYGSMPTFFSSIITPITRGFNLDNLNYDETNDIYEVTINNTDEYSYILELFDLNSKFASNNFKYLFEQDIKINLDNVLSPKYNNGIAATFMTKNADNTTNKLNYATFFLSKFDYKITTVGVDCYGVFPYLTGTVKYLNFIVGNNATVSFNKASDNKTAIGAIAGEVEGGSIESCNVYMDMSINSSVGQYYLGSTVGLLTGEGEVNNVTSNGTITTTNSDSDAKSFDDSDSLGAIVGGVIGYIDEATGSVDTLLSTININAAGYTGQTVTVGGVVGAGYLKAATQLQNRGTITINGTYSNLYIAGVIGRLLGLNQQITYFTNNGNVSVTQINAPTYTAGVMNADIDTGKSNLKLKNTKYFYASCLSNGANIVVTGTKTDTYMYTNVINVMNNNGFITKLSGLYNLNYIFGYSSALGTQTINMNLIDKFSPVLMSNSTSQNNYIDLTTAYNLRDITFTQTVDVTNAVTYTGCVMGNYINYIDVRNEGNLNLNVTNSITGNIKLFGVFEFVSSNNTAKSIFNGGDIKLNVRANITGNTYLSGICHINSNHTNSSFYTNGNPLNTTFDKDYTGTLDNVINAGNITFELNDLVTANNKTVSDTASAYTIDGNVLISGITSSNESTITNGFNLGDLFIASAFKSDKTSIAAGISCIQAGSNASIINSANNGDIKNINFSTKGYIYSSGIVGRNDSIITMGNINAANNNHSQVIAFTINYGQIVAFNGAPNLEMSTTSYQVPKSLAAGIIGSGLCNIVNVVNYGKNYGSQLAAGIIALCDFSKFQTEVTENSRVNISNCLTYTNSYEITPTISDNGESKNIYFSEVLNLYSSRATAPVTIETPSAADNAYNGTVIAVINFNNNDNAQYINIRYLVSFSTIVQTFRLQINTPNSVSGNTQTMYSANKNQQYLGSALVYSPLSTLDDELGNVGIFSENFRFRKAISGELEDGTTYFNTTRYVTDLYLTDFFEFVGFTKVNPFILNKIGWDTISYSSAATDFVKNLSELEIVIKSYKQQDSNGFNTLLQKAFQTSTWIQYCDSTVLESLLDELLNAQDLVSLKNITKYLFFTSSNKSSITVSMRETFATALINSFTESNLDLRQFLDSIMTSEIMANIIAGNDYNNQKIKQKIEQYIDTISTDKLITLTYKYLNYLENDHYDELFNNTYKEYYTAEKIELLTELLSNLDSDIIVDLADELDLSVSESISYKLKIALDSLTPNQKSILYTQFINDLSSNNATVLTTVETAIKTLLSTFDIASYTEETDTEPNTFSNSITSNTQKIDLWNIIKYDQNVLDYLDEYYQSQDMYVYDANTGLKHTGFLDKATEYRNTYQTNDHPSYYEWNYNTSTGYSSLSANTPRGASDHNRGTTGVYRASYDNEDLINRFIYTPDDLVTDGSTSFTYTYNGNNKTVTPKTYFYGPYLSNTVLSDYHGQLWNYNAQQGAVGIGRNLKVNTSGGAITKSYIPIFIALDEQFVNNKILETPYGSQGIEGISTATSFIWNNNSFKVSPNGATLTNNDSQSQWVSVDIMTKKPDNNRYVLKKDHSSYSSVRYGFNYDLAGLTNSGELKNYKLSYDGVVNNNAGFDKTDIVYGYATATMITGIFYELSQWERNGLFLTAKENNQGLFGVVTSQYIDYTIDDLANVDGKLTKGRSTGIDSEDEIAIINKVMGHLFATNKGKSVVMTALGKYFSTTGVTNVQLAQNYLTAFNNNQNWKNDFLAKIPFNSDTYGVTTNINGQTTVRTYLEYIYNNLTHSGYENIIAHSLENKSNFTKVLQYLLDKKYGYYAFLQSIDNESFYDWFNDAGEYSSDTYSLAELQYLIDYIVNNNNNTQLDNIISGVSDTEINNILQAALSNAYDLSNQTLSGYTFGNNASAILAYNTYDNTNYYSAISFDSTSTIQFTTGNQYPTQKLNVVAYGTGSISIGETTYNLTNTITQYTFDLDASTAYTLNTTAGVNIIKMETYYGSSSDINTTTTSATATFSGDYTVYNTTYNLNGINVTGIQLTGDNTITINLPNTINSRIRLACQRIGNRNATINLDYGNTTRTITATDTAQGVSSNQAINSNTFTISLANTGRGAYIYGFTTANNTNSYYYFQDMIYINGVYYLPARTTTATTAANATFTGTNVELSYVRNGANNSTFSINNEDYTGTNTTQYYSGTNSVVINANTGITNINLIARTTVSELNSNTPYNSLINQINTEATANKYFAYTNNDLANLIIRNRFNEATCKYDLNIDNLPAGAITNYTDSYNFYNITGTAQYYSQKVTNSATITGKAFTNALQLPNSNAAYISFTASANSYLYILAKQNANSNLVITNNTDTYTINLNRTDSIYAINIKNAGTYRIYSIGATSNIYNVYYATGTTILGNTYNNTAAKGEYIKSIFTNYANFYRYYQRNNLFENSTNITTESRKFNEIVDLLYGTKYSDMDLYNELTDNQIIDIIKSLFMYQDDFLNSAITDSTLSYITREQLINEISAICKVNSAFLIDVFNQANININNITSQSGDYYAWVYRLVAAYVSTNYLMNYNELNINDSTLTKSELSTILNSIDNHSYSINGTTYTFTSSCQFISSDTTINNENFIKLMNALGHDLSSTGYGIYALSSSHGKLNGEFIPDNLNLDDMDPEYTLAGSIYTLTDASVTDSMWRGGTSDDDEDNISDTTSVNYAFYVEMKQLIKSISTTVFELTLTNGGNTYYGDIDLDNATITYYVHSLTTGTYTVDNIDLAYMAKAYDGKITTESGTEFKKNSTLTVSALDTTAKQFTVFAEDTTVYKTYSIIFKQLSTNLTMVYDIEKTADATATSLTVGPSSANTTVTLNITSTNVKLPKGFDLKPYLSLVLMDDTAETNTKYKMNSDYVTISTLSTDHKIKADGSAVATLIISYKLPAGTYKIKLAICNAEASVEYIKTASNDTSLQLRFENKDVFSGNSKTATTKIPFGRAYNNIELTDFEGIYSDYYEFYLDSYTLAANATMTATVTNSQANKTYSFDGETSVSYKITTYKIVYTVTAEDGSTATYTHNLEEKNPYAENDTFADVFATGTKVTGINTSFITNNSQAKVTFERGYEQYYRIKYKTDNIYTLSNNITYEALETTDTNHKGIATLNIEYRGLSADVNTDCDAGVYSFIYKYKNVQEWGLTATLNSDGTYTFTKDTDTYIEFTFPRLVIEKTYSTDATIHSIFLIDSHKGASAAATAMSTIVMKPDADHLQGDEGDEVSYEAMLNGDTPINVGTEKISYKNVGTIDYSAVIYKDYYIVGKVSNAQLSNYAPSFTTEDHAFMFQSTSLYKLQNYGKNLQGTKLDSTVLSNHDTTYLYVPFTYQKMVDGTNTTLFKIFLIELDGQTLKKVYDDQFGGTGTEITTLNLTLDDIRILKNTTNATWPTITTDGTTYTLASCVGDKNNNPSLYMDYIGNPLDNHFWYVSYVVFSEDYIRTDNLTDPKYVKFFHIALIDVSNNVYFNIKVITPNNQIFADIQELYITVFGYKYDDEQDETPETKTVSAYVRQTTEDENTITYELVYSLQILPSAYYYFMINLPGGYDATTTIEAAKINHTDYLGHGASHEDAYLPPSSIIVQRVSLTMNVIESTGEDASYWAISTSSTYKITSFILNSKIGGDED